MRSKTPALAIAAALALPVLAQEAARPYSGEEKPEIKALSADEIAAYRSGAGMGYAKAAELNHYPGPRHVLELAKELEATQAQTQKLRSVYDRMHAETVRLGERVVDQERNLDRLFAAGKIDETTLAKSVREIARLQGEIRLSHLAAHLDTRALLTSAQVARYDALRGYSEGKPAAHDPARHGH